VSNHDSPGGSTGEQLEQMGSILIDKETWGIQELCEVVASRYFLLGMDGPIPASWEVAGIDGKDVSEQLHLMNDHIEELGLIGSLEASNPPILSISRYPSGQSILKGWQHGFVWFVMASFMTIVGSSWSRRYVGDSENIPFGSFGQSLIFFTIPILATILLASYLRKTVAYRSGTKIGHIIPIIFPMPTPAWPFGIIGTLGQKSADIVPIADRKSLGRIEIVAPLTLFVMGAMFTIIGITITPLDPPSLTESPIIFEINSISELASGIIVGEDLKIKLQWLHPLGIAGIGLSIVGWGLLLPIPGFPGDRVLHSIIGPSEMRKGGSQTSIFIIMLIVLVMVFAISEYLPWIFLAAIGAWQRFSPESVPQPLVVDEFSELEGGFRNGLVSIIAIILIAGFPGTMPSQLLDDYDAGISTASWPEEVFFSDGETVNLTLGLDLVGVMPVSGTIQMRLEGGIAENWSLDSGCSKELDFCKFSGATQHDVQNLALTISSPNMSFSPHLLRIILEIEGAHNEHEIILRGEAAPGPQDPFWNLNHTDQGMKICTPFVIDKVGSFSTEDPFWEIEGSLEKGIGLTEICMIGHEGAIQALENIDAQQRKLGPSLIFEGLNGTGKSWILPINGTEPQLNTVDGEFVVSEWFAGNSSYVINHAESGSPYCPSIDSSPEVNTSSNWTRFVDDHSAIRIVGNFDGNNSLILGREGWLSVCHDDGRMDYYTISDGIDLLINSGQLGERIDGTNIIIHNRENFSLPVSVELYGDFQEGGIWNLDDGQNHTKNIGPGEIASFEIRAIPGGELDQMKRAVWVTASTSGIEFHLAARCPSMGCT